LMRRLRADARHLTALEMAALVCAAPFLLFPPFART